MLIDYGHNDGELEKGIFGTVYPAEEVVLCLLELV